MNALMKATVLVLNRNWQAINVRTPQEAFCMMATNVATGLEIEGEDHIPPVPWEEWIALPIREKDEAVHTVRGQIRVPTVIVAVNYARVPKKRPKLCARTIRERDGNRCQYTGRVLRPDEGSLDHVVPRSRGGKDVWENLVWSAKEVNQKKADRLPHEAGLKLLSKPRAPKELPASALIRNAHEVQDWRLFLDDRYRAGGNSGDLGHESLDFAGEPSHLFQRTLRENGKFLRPGRQQFLSQRGE